MMNKITLAFVILLLSGQTQAALVDSADGTYFTDTSSGLDWLDLGFTKLLNHAQVESQLGPGGAFEGYRYASFIEVFNMFNEAGGNGSYLGLDPAHIGWAPDLMEMWGITDLVPGAPGESPEFLQSLFFESDFIAPNPPGTPLYFYGELSFFPATLDLGVYVTLIESLLPPDEQPGNIGSALVRNSVIPLPAGAWLFGTALIGLVGMMRRKKEGKI